MLLYDGQLIINVQSNSGIMYNFEPQFEPSGREQGGFRQVYICFLFLCFIPVFQMKQIIIFCAGWI